MYFVTVTIAIAMSLDRNRVVFISISHLYLYFKIDRLIQCLAEEKLSPTTCRGLCLSTSLKIGYQGWFIFGNSLWCSLTILPSVRIRP